jgi:hypothetical protein
MKSTENRSEAVGNELMVIDICGTATLPSSEGNDMMIFVNQLAIKINLWRHSMRANSIEQDQNRYHMTYMRKDGAIP